jgi:microcystin-dependent protein
MAMEQRMTRTEAATRIWLGEGCRLLLLQGESRFPFGALTIALIALLGAGSIHAQGGKEALSIDQQGNVGVGTGVPQAFQVELPESAKPSAPRPGVTLSGGADGNANIELRNNGSGTPYIDFAQGRGGDYDARIILKEPGKLAIEGATLSAKSVETDSGISLDALRNALNMLVPIGTIMAYGGDTTKADVVSQLAAQGWLPCDGRAVSKTTYADLFKVIGTSFGAEGRLDLWGASATSGPMIMNRVFAVTNPDGFRVPDLRGRFLRGTDQRQQRDPDAALRQDLAGGGNDGDRVGSVQEDQFRSHKHTFDAWHGGGIDGTSQADPPAMAGWIRGSPDAKAVQATGGAETRPKNIYVNWIIRASHLLPRVP